MRHNSILNYSRLSQIVTTLQFVTTKIGILVILAHNPRTKKFGQWPRACSAPILLQGFDGNLVIHVRMGHISFFQNRDEIEIDTRFTFLFMEKSSKTLLPSRSGWRGVLYWNVWPRTLNKQ
jgi:hypothetical protein